MEGGEVGGRGDHGGPGEDPGAPRAEGDWLEGVDGGLLRVGEKVAVMMVVVVMVSVCKRRRRRFV